MSKVWLAWILIGVGLIIILLALGILFYQQRADHITPAPLPDYLASLSMERSVFGSSALNELAWLHGPEFQLNKGAVGTYGEGNEITLYVAGTPLKFLAGRLLVAMRDKIARSETPFTPLAEREQGGRTVYELQGMGQRHFYFRSNDLVVWLAVDEVISDAALNQVLDFYP
jgi:hypothetical protein